MYTKSTQILHKKYTIFTQVCSTSHHMQLQQFTQMLHKHQNQHSPYFCTKCTQASFKYFRFLCTKCTQLLHNLCTTFTLKLHKPHEYFSHCTNYTLNVHNHYTNGAQLFTQARVNYTRPLQFFTQLLHKICTIVTQNR